MADLSKAIRNRSLIKLKYPPGERIVEPHAFGRRSDGKLLLRAYQIDGASASGEHQNWKLFRIDRMANVVVSHQTFVGPRPSYKRGDKAMRGGIICEL